MLVGFEHLPRIERVENDPHPESSSLSPASRVLSRTPNAQQRRPRALVLLTRKGGSQVLCKLQAAPRKGATRQWLTSSAIEGRFHPFFSLALTQTRLSHPRKVRRRFLPFDFGLQAKASQH
eukprot:583324-Rhodomonas_salina.1